MRTFIEPYSTLDTKDTKIGKLAAHTFENKRIYSHCIYRAHIWPLYTFFTHISIFLTFGVFGVQRESNVLKTNTLTAGQQLKRLVSFGVFWCPAVIYSNLQDSKKPRALNCTGLL